MSTDFTRYQPPGVYVDSTSDGVVTTTSAPETIVTLVGPSRGYQIQTQAMTALNTDQPLLKAGVLGLADPSPDLKVVKTDGTVLVADTDYTVTYGSGPTGITMIKRKSSSTLLTAGDSIFVSYAYADSSFFQPKTFDDFSTIESVYGPSFVSVLPTSGSQVSSPLSLAAMKAFENGAKSVICLATEPVDGGNTLRARFSQAYDKLANNPTVTMIVPVLAAQSGDTGSSYTGGLQGFITDLKTHCVNQSADGFRRIAIVGADTIYDETTTGMNAVAANTLNARVMIAYPTRMMAFNASVSGTTEIGGPYLAAAYAGTFAGDSVARGLTQQPIQGFQGIPVDLQAKMTKTFKNTLSAAGVAVTEPTRSGSLICRHGTSSDPTDLVTTEMSITREGDTLFQLVNDGLQGAGLIGDPIDSDMTVRVKGIVTGVLEGAVADGIIRGYPVLQVRQQALPSGNPTAIEVQFGWQPFLPLNYILVSFSLDLTTGDTTDTAAA